MVAYNMGYLGLFLLTYLLVNEIVDRARIMTRSAYSHVATRKGRR